MLDARARDREGCALVADKCGDIARVVMTMLREVVVEIIFASRVVSVYVVSCCRRVIIVGTVSGATMEGATASERR